METVEIKAVAVAGLDISSGLTSEDLSKARISLRDHGISGIVAFTAMQALANAVKEL